MSTTTEAAPTAWAQAYEAQLAKALRKYAAHAAEHFASERARLEARMQEERGWGLQGAIAYAIGHYADDVIRAEFQATLGRIALQLLDEPDPDAPPTATAIHAHLLEQCRRTVHEGLGARSTNQWGNLMEQELAREANRQADSMYSYTLANLALSAQYQAVYEVVPDAMRKVQRATDAVQVAHRHAERARSEGGRERAANAVAAAVLARKAAIHQAQEALEAAGVPAGIVGWPA